MLLIYKQSINTNIQWRDQRKSDPDIKYFYQLIRSLF
jgi:hypothetical protein